MPGCKTMQQVTMTVMQDARQSLIPGRCMPDSGVTTWGCWQLMIMSDHSLSTSIMSSIGEKWSLLFDKDPSPADYRFSRSSMPATASSNDHRMIRTPHQQVSPSR